MKRIAMFLIVAIAVQAVTAGICRAQRRGDPSPQDLAKIKAAAPKKATAKPAKPRKMLVLSYQSHDGGRFAGEKAMEIMGEQTGAYTLVFARDAKAVSEVLVPEKLKEFDAVCLNNSTGGAGKSANGKTWEENLSAYVSAGGGLVGIHSATDNKAGAIFGGFFTQHPWGGKVGVKIDEPDHTLCKAFGGKGFMVSDEIYQFAKIYTREKLRVLLSLDMTKTQNRGKRKDKDYAVAWIKAHGKGRVFYCSLGHNPKVFQDANLLRFYLDGIQFALGDIKADTTPSAKLAKKPKPALVPDEKNNPKAASKNNPKAAPKNNPKAAAKKGPKPAAAAEDKCTGEYAGKLTADGKEGDGLAQVIAEGKGQYRAVLMRGLWKTAKDLKQFRVELTGAIDAGGNVPLKGQGWTGKLVGGKTLTAKADKGRFEGKWSVRSSPTLGAPPPKGAIVLMAFNAGKKPSLDEWTNKKWRPLETAAVEVRGGTNFTVRKFGSAKFHVEFRCPYEPTRRGQGRGNSGVYLQKRYEIQVLDSFGLKSRPNDCGAIYGVANTKVNACLPPLQWQTYDIEFKAARIGPDGKIARPPTMTVQHNGILTHENQVLPGKTTAAAASGHTPKDSLMLQDHGNKVHYRNIWAVEEKD